MVNKKSKLIPTQLYPYWKIQKRRRGKDAPSASVTLHQFRVQNTYIGGADE